MSDEIDPKIKEWIDNASYEALLTHWRFAKIGSPYFKGKTGEYYAKVMSEKKNALTHEEQVRVSKNVGWGD